MNIRVNTVLPGWWLSEMTGEPCASGALRFRPGPYKSVLRTPFPQPAEPHEILGPILLLSSAAGAFIHGAVFPIEGGLSMAIGVNDGLHMPEDSYT